MTSLVDLQNLKWVCLGGIFQCVIKGCVSVCTLNICPKSSSGLSFTCLKSFQQVPSTLEQALAVRPVSLLRPYSLAGAIQSSV